jgi:type IV secretory pathway VirB10-like protein
MASKATRIAAGTSVLGLGGLAAVAVGAGKSADTGSTAKTAAKTPPVEVKTVTVQRVIHRTVHAKPKRVHAHAAVAARTAHAAAPAATPAAGPAPAPAPAPVKFTPVTRHHATSPAPAPAPKQAPVRTRTSGTGEDTSPVRTGPSGTGGGSDDGNEHEGGDD